MATGEIVAAPDVRRICIEENQASRGEWKKSSDVASEERRRLPEESLSLAPNPLKQAGRSRGTRCRPALA